MTTLSDTPSEDDVSSNVWSSPKEERKKLIMMISKNVIVSAAKVTYNDTQGMTAREDGDMVYTHSTHLLSAGLLYLYFRDAIKEGDGERVLKSCRYLLPIFIASARKNYAEEALYL